MVHLKDLIELFTKMVWLTDIKVTVDEILRIEILKLLSQYKNTETLYFQGMTSC